MLKPLKETWVTGLLSRMSEAYKQGHYAGYHGHDADNSYEGEDAEQWYLGYVDGDCEWDTEKYLTQP